MNLYIIDAIGPFFRGYKRESINWSKIPFHVLEKKGRLKRKKFEKINKDFRHFAISLKDGDTDFFSGLELSPFFQDMHFQKILELQTRREREGFGTLPFYTGWQYEKYQQAVQKNPTVIGISVWCQTGGWCSWRNLTFLKRSSYWNEINTCTTLDIFKNDHSADEALRKFVSSEHMVEFVRLGTWLVHHLLYIDGYRLGTFYFRRLRIPPLVWVFWDHITLNHLIIAFHACLGAKQFKILKKEIKQFYKLGKKLDVEDIAYQRDFLRSLAYCRRAMWKRGLKTKHLKRIQAFQEKYKNAPQFNINLSAGAYDKVELMTRIFIRDRANYRFIDKFFLLPPMSYLFRVAYRLQIKNLPKFANKLAMGVDSLFK